MTTNRLAVTAIGRDALRAAWEVEAAGQSPVQSDWAREWTGLVECGALDPPLAPQWNWISATSGGFDNRLQALSVADAGGRGFAAFLEYRTRQFGIPLLVRELPGCDLMCYHPAWVTSGDPMSLVEALVHHGGRRCQILYAPEVVLGSQMEQCILAMASRRVWQVLRVPSHRSPYVPVSGTWEDQLASRSSNFRYNLKRKLRALEALGAVSERWFTDPASIDELLAHMHTIEESSWKVGAEMAISRSRRETTYHEMLLPWLARRGALQANVLYVDGQPSAYSLCYVAAGRMAQMKTSFSEKHASASPGVTVTANSIRRAHELGLSEFDFLGDMMPHKAQWTSLTRDHEHLYVYTDGPSARLAGLLKRIVKKVRSDTARNTVGRSGHKDRDSRA